MSTQIGTATDYVDLLNKLDAFLCTTGHAWGKRFTGVGTGDLTAYLGTASSVAETFTLTATNATTFSVVGSVSGALANATVGTPYTSAKIAFTLTAGGTAYQAGDVWTINTAPPWQRLRRMGWADSRSVTTNLQTWENLLNSSTSTATSTATATSIDYTMVAPTRIRRILARAPSTSSRMPTSWTLRYKDLPGDPWTTAQTWTQAWTSNLTVQFQTSADPGEHLYWRIEMSGATTSTEIDNLLLYANLSGSGPDMVVSEYSLAWQAPGLDGTRQIFCLAQTEWVTGSDIWNARFGVSRQWVANEVSGSQPGHSRWRRMLLGTTPIGYWFIVNGQRAMVVTAFQGLMQVAYIGFGLPYEPPSSHAYPAICGATTGYSGDRFSNTSPWLRCPWDPGSGSSSVPAGSSSLAAYMPHAEWDEFANIGSSSDDSVTSLLAPCGRVWPSWCADSSIDGRPLYYVTNVDGSRPLLPCVLFVPGPITGIVSHPFGEFDGLYWTTGFGTSPQAVIRYQGFDHLIVNNLYRTAAQDFAAVRLD